MLRQYFEGTETITHGANMYNRWNSSAHDALSLVVSDWGLGEGDLAKLLASAALGDHPYTEVVVMTTRSPVGEAGNATVLNVTWALLAEKGIAVHFVDREKSRDFMDWCTAPVSSKWFMYTNS
jgi:DNA-binding NarL/FixJ family response regulator